MKTKLTIGQLLGETFDNYSGVTKVHSQKRADFVFHMTDWKSDLETLHLLYNDPGMLSRKEAQAAVFGYLAHVTWHLNAAHRLLLGYEVPDPFGMGEAGQAKKLGPKSVRTKARKMNRRTAEVGTASPRDRKKTRK
jgi:hypothetical protein